ncbi:hypothetical protein [Niabella hibiscisoli]|uniref:hypothetical protein n=1 Tax=Niabella hibiscisoli TaxID=1825928 RepID=UPI001F114FCF|nr:hypothetical protein [Niabella hibiscisoli]MCH5717123.1 hypothetical protein [Niabella hibiscisoli]
MGYYIRVLGSQDPDIHINELIQSLSADGLTAKLEFDPTEEPSKWTTLDILNADGEPLAQLERNPVIEGELGQEELNEFKEDIQDCKPASGAVKWLTNYFDKVKVIYAFQMLNAAFENGNFEVVSNIKTKIWNKTKGILQADNEGFSNEEGYHILWQFSETVTGNWSCAVRNWLGKWNTFVMDLGDTTQRQDFQNGKVPKKAKRL